MATEFDPEEAKSYLKQKEQQKKAALEKDRQETLQKVIDILKRELQNKNIEVFLVGSITQPLHFSKNSDVDIVLKNFKGDRFEIWSHLESLIDRKVEIILFENCSFQDHIQTNGLKVI